MTTSTTGTSGTVAGQTTAASSPTGATAVTSKSSNTGLAAGLGAGLGVAAIAIAALAFFLFRSRRRDHTAAQALIPAPPHTIEMAGSAPIGELEQKQHRGFYGGGYSNYQSSEMAADDGNTRLEMPGSEQGYDNVQHELDS
jgi:hypothetical protein